MFSGIFMLNLIELSKLLGGGGAKRYVKKTPNVHSFIQRSTFKK